MVTTPHHRSKPSGFLLYALAFILSFLLCLPWVSAKETPKPKPQDWQINGIVAALDDRDDKVKVYALNKLVKYDLKDFKFVGKKLEDVAQKAAKILKDKSVDKDVRFGAAWALANLGEAAKPYVKDIADIFKDKSVNPNLRRDAAIALGNLGEATKPYVKDIADILKDKSVDKDVRFGAINAAVTLGKIEQLNLNNIVVILDSVYYPDQLEVQWRFLTYFLAGGTDDVKTLLTWLGKPKAIPREIKYEDGKKTLEVFRKAWEPSQKLP